MKQDGDTTNLKLDREDHSDEQPPQNGTAFQSTDDSSEIKSEPWFKKYWRPAAAWTYLTITTFDFLAAPVAVYGWAYWTHTVVTPWVPLTLGGGAIFHLAFGAILGIYAWGRTKEKIESKE